MECYFATSKKDHTLHLDQEDTKHIAIVLRRQIGDEITVIFDSLKYQTKIKELKPFVICEIIKPLPEETREMTTKVTVIIALLKEQKWDFFLQKATELGVYRIVPIQMSRCVSVIHNPNQEQQKLVRWQKVMKAAAKQSNRNMIPQITNVVKQLKDLSPYLGDANFVAYENEHSNANFLVTTENKSLISVIIGPEGGITTTELKTLVGLGFQSISLGRTILRAETAPLYFLSLLNYQDFTSSHKKGE